LQRDARPNRRNGPKWPKTLTKANEDEDEDDDEEKPQRSRVSLSGLLNAIDGVAAPEGHILIMTTNKPEKLDEALVRSGRISVRVSFEKATGEQAKDIFMRMYWHDEEKSENHTSKKGAPTPSAEHDHLKTLAQQFGEQIPEHVFSPADLQDFLLTRRKDPQRAIDELEEWKAKAIEERAKKAEDAARRRAEKAEKAKRKLAEVMALSTIQPGAVPAGGSPLEKEGIKDNGRSEEEPAATLVEEAAQG
jgi:SpoVK/Ycf46/Vps4 family AAA+-type ATPase